jgi:hypothetical protein
MPQIYPALPWAIAMILLALAGNAGLIADDAVLTMLAILPAVMVATMPGRRCAGSLRGA